MSQLPRYGGQGPKTVTTTTTRTSRIPGTNTTVTQSRTTVAEVAPCGTGTQVNVRAQGGIPRSGAAGLRPPSGLRAPGRAPGPSRPEACETNTCPSGPRPPARPTGLPQVRLEGLPRAASALPAPGQRPAVQQTRTGGLQPPQTSGMQRQSRTGLQQPSQRPTGLQRPTQTGLQRPTPTPTGLQRPTPTGLQRPTPSGLQRPTPSGLQRPTPTGGARYVTPQMPAARPLPKTRSGTCSGPCSSAKQRVGVMVQPPTPSRVTPRHIIPPQTPTQTPVPQISPSAPQRLTERPTGPAAYKMHMFDPKYKLQKPKTPFQLPVPRQRRTPSASPEERASRSLMDKSLARVGEKVTARAASLTPCPKRYVETPEGLMEVQKETVFQKRIERDEEGEKIVKNLQMIETDAEGVPKMIEMNLQQLDPEFALAEGKEVITITSRASMTESYTTVTKEISRATTSPVAEAASMPPEEVAKLVEEENEDVDNTLKMLPPDLVLSPGKYEMKKRLQHLQLNSESVALLEQSITHPEPRADEAQAEPTPEVMAAMMHTVEKGVPPQSTPDQVFNTLFVETTNERFIKLSPVTEGPLQDVVVPVEVPVDIHNEVITDEMERLTEKIQNIPTAAELPALDIFDMVMGEDKMPPTKGNTNVINYQPITDEKSLWVNANLEHLVNVVGAAPVEVLEPANVSELETSGKLEEQLAAGMEYYVDADPIQYMSRVQLRGSQMPNYFPGYLFALPEFPGIVRVANSPDEVFASAWKSAQPKYFPDESMQSLIF